MIDCVGKVKFWLIVIVTAIMLEILCYFAWIRDSQNYDANCRINISDYFYEKTYIVGFDCNWLIYGICSEYASCKQKKWH